MIYTTIQNIAKRLSSRIRVIDSPSIQGIQGITSSTIGTELLTLIIDSTEEFVNLYLGMIYVMPLVNNHPFLTSIVDRLVVAETLTTYFPSTGESNQPESYPQVLRANALSDFQCLFDGTGIYVPGVDSIANQRENDERAIIQKVKTVILNGETLKPYIGYDYDGDNLADSNLFKNQTTDPSFYTAGNFDKEKDQEVINNVRVLPEDYRGEQEVIIDFW